MSQKLWRKDNLRRLTESKRYWFVYGLDVDDDDPPGPFESWDEAKSVWDRIGGELTLELARKSPGARPWPFWKWDHCNDEVGVDTPNFYRMEYLAKHNLLFPFEKKPVTQFLKECGSSYQNLDLDGSDSG